MCAVNYYTVRKQAEDVGALLEPRDERADAVARALVWRVHLEDREQMLEEGRVVRLRYSVDLHQHPRRGHARAAVCW